MMSDQVIPDDVRRKARDYFRRAKQLTKRQSYFGLIDSTLSKDLKTDLRVLMSRNTFDCVWWLNGCEASFLEELSQLTAREAYAMDEPIPNNGPDDALRLCLLVNGVACRAGAILTTGASWGDILLSVPRMQDLRKAKALTFCELVVLSGDGLRKLMPRYPESHAVVRQAALKLATRRMFILIAMYSKLRNSSASSQPATERGQITPRLQAALAASTTPLSAIEAKALLRVQSPSSKAAPPSSPSAILKSLQPVSPWRELSSHKYAPLKSPPSSPHRPPPFSTFKNSPAEVKGAVEIETRHQRAVMSRLDDVEATMQLMLRNMAERDAREEVTHAALLAHAQAGEAALRSAEAALLAASFGDNPLAA